MLHHTKSQSESRPTEPLREEHRHLFPHVAALAATADAVGIASREELRTQVDESYEFLADHLIPHAEAEDEFLYPVVDRLLGATGETRATDTMRRDHVEVGRLTAELGRLRGRLQEDVSSPADELELRRVLYGLYAVVGLHFAKEEEVYLPVLDRELTADAAQSLFDAMEHSGAGHAAVHAH